MTDPACHWRARFYQYLRLTRLDKPVGALLLLWPAWWALIVAGNGAPSFKNILIFTLGVFSMRSAGCAINDFADRHFDAHVERTAKRPLAAGLITPREAVLVFVVLALLSFLLVLMTNAFTVGLSFLAVLLAFIYPFSKRFTHLPQLFLAAAYSMPVPMAFAAQSNQLPSAAYILFFANVVWTVGYDTLYAMSDKEEDLLIGVKSTAILAGRHDAHLAWLLHGIFMALMLVCGWMLALGWIFYLSWLLCWAQIGYQVYTVSKKNKQAYFAAFSQNNYLGFIMTAGLIGSYWL